MIICYFPPVLKSTQKYTSHFLNAHTYKIFFHSSHKSVTSNPSQWVLKRGREVSTYVRQDAAAVSSKAFI